MDLKKKIAIYLAGSIQKGSSASLKELFWTEKEMEEIRSQLANYEVVFLNPAFRSDDLTDQFSVFGRDVLQVVSSTFVFVDARDRRGLGVGAEMMWAKVNRIPVITWAPKNSHYRKNKAIVLDKEVEGFVHPFVYALSDQIVETPSEGAFWMEKILLDPASYSVKGLEEIHSAMNYYKDTQLERDEPMKAFLLSPFFDRGAENDAK